MSFVCGCPGIRATSRCASTTGLLLKFLCAMVIEGPRPLRVTHGRANGAVPGIGWVSMKGFKDIYHSQKYFTERPQWS